MPAPRHRVVGPEVIVAPLGLLAALKVNEAVSRSPHSLSAETLTNRDSPGESTTEGTVPGLSTPLQLGFCPLVPIYTVVPGHMLFGSDTPALMVTAGGFLTPMETEPFMVTV